MLQEHKFWEESFKVYERGLSLFKWPHVRDLWQTYLSHFVQRYKGTKLERARDLFRQAIDSVSMVLACDVHIRIMQKLLSVCMCACLSVHLSVCPSAPMCLLVACSLSLGLTFRAKRFCFSVLTVFC